MEFPSFIGKLPDQTAYGYKPCAKPANVQFEFIVAAGLGNSVDDFNNAIMHIFPGKYHSAENEWGTEPAEPQVKAGVLEAIKDDR